MNIEYEILILPNEDQRGDRAWFYVDGEFKITDNEGLILFEDNNIALAEFAIYCRKWLNGEFKHFQFSSMDFEEEPLIEIRMLDETTCQFYSAWHGLSPSVYLLDDFKDVFDLFEKKLAKELAVNHCCYI